MKIRELFEQSISSVPPGQSGPLPPTSPTEPAPNTSNAPKDPNAANTADTQQKAAMDMSQVKSNLDSLKPTIKTANGGVDFDTTALAKALTTPTGTAPSVNPQLAKSLQAIMPALGAVEKTPGGANALKGTMQTAAQGQLKQQIGQQKPQTTTP
jgi:hypothetical protein